MEQEQVLEDGM